jgi:hypothetical protein
MLGAPSHSAPALGDHWTNTCVSGRLRPLDVDLHVEDILGGDLEWQLHMSRCMAL